MIIGRQLVKWLLVCLCW